jgi:glucan biosynthesis protein C
VTSTKPGTVPPERLYFVDWLRILSMALIFFFHNARFFDIGSDWHVKNATSAMAPTILVAFLSTWIMPLFFVIAGAGSYLSLRFRNAGDFARERTLRLLVPLIFGMLVVVAPQAYFEQVSHGQLADVGFFQFYPSYIRTLPELHWYHLWFLAYLYIFSLIVLPLFLPSGQQRKSPLSRLATAVGKPWAWIPLLVLTVGLVNTAIFPDGFWGHTASGGWNIVSYFLFFVFGYVIFANPAILESITRLRWAALTTGTVLLSIGLAFLLPLYENAQAYYGTPVFAAGQVLRALCCWAWIVAIIGLGSRYMTRHGSFLSYANEAVLPFYVLHQTVIITIGFYIVQWDMSIAGKYAVISATSFAAIMGIYELLIRRFRPFRFLFGMKLKKRAMTPLTAPA